MKRLRVGIVGASGYAGATLASLIAGHSGCELVFCTSTRRVGEPVFPEDRGNRLCFESNDAAEKLAHGCDFVFLAAGADVAANLAPRILEAGARVIDLSGGFRLREPSMYPQWYRFAHASPQLLAEAHYGLPELFGAPPPSTRLIANPGCYPTASLLALAPLLRERLIESRGIVIDAKSGVTGAGRQANEDFSFSEVAGDLRPYKLLRHQHTPEIETMLSRFSPADESAKITFTPHLLPIRRGLLATCYARPRPGTTAARVTECLADAYASSNFVRAVDPAQVTIKSVAGTNAATVGATANDDIVIVASAIDNLLKGAAGQAVQNFNLICGFDEREALRNLHRMAP